MLRFGFITLPKQINKDDLLTRIISMSSVLFKHAYKCFKSAVKDGVLYFSDNSALHLHRSSAVSAQGHILLPDFKGESSRST